MSHTKFMPKGSPRPTAGRPPADPSGVKRARVWFFLTPDEAVKLRETLDYIRTQKAEQTGSDTDSEYSPKPLSKRKP